MNSYENFINRIPEFFNLPDEKITYESGHFTLSEGLKSVVDESYINKIYSDGDHLHFRIQKIENETEKFNAFSIPNKDIKLNDIDPKNHKLFNLKAFEQYDVAEVVRGKYAKLYFDIDFKGTEGWANLEHVMSFVKAINDRLKGQLTGLIEFKNEEDMTDDFELLNNEEDVIKIVNPNQTKVVSAHLFINGFYINREDFFNSLHGKHFGKLFDTSVYKKNQKFRFILSGKGINKRPPPPITQETLDHIKSLGLERFVCTKTANDTKEITFNDISDIFDNYFPQVIDDKPQEILHETEQDGQHQTQGNEQDEIIKYSIFTPLVKHILTDQPDNFTLSGELKFFESSPLTIEEFNDEIDLLAKQLITSDYTVEDNREWLNRVKSSLNYSQNLGNMKGLWILKKKTQEQLDSLDKEDEINKKILLQVIDDIKTFILKYSKQYFIRIPKYDIFDKTGELKIFKIFNNICYFVKTDEFYYPFNKTSYNKTQLKATFKMNGKTIEQAVESITPFYSIQEYNRLQLEYNYSLANHEALRENTLNYMDLLKQTFVSEEDFKFYIGFFAEKLNNPNKSLPKSIISQGPKDCLKTQFIEMFSDYLEFNKCNVNNFNKKLNGDYLDSQILLIEELPDNVERTEFPARLKQYSQSKTLDAEKKGKGVMTIKNKLNIIINTNHNLMNITFKKEDCDAILKRFKIFERKSIQSRPNSTLDNVMGDDNDLYVYDILMYIKNECDEYISYYYLHLENSNNVEQRYSKSAIPEQTQCKILIRLNMEEFVDYFKTVFLDTKKRFRIASFLKYLQNLSDGEYKPNQKTMSQEMIYNELISKDNDGKHYRVSEEQMKKIYDEFFEYEDLNNDYDN